MEGKEIWLGNINVLAEDFSEEVVTNEITGNELRKIKFVAPLIGVEQREALGKTLQGNYTIAIPDEDIEFNAKTVKSMWSYNAQVLTDTTPIDYSIEAIELDKDLPEDHNLMGQITSAVIMNWIRTRAISELLIKKGVFSEQEYEDILSKVAERDFDNLKNLITHGVPERKKMGD